MIDFYTSWCKWCKVFDQRTFTDAKVISQAEDFVCAKVNAEDKANMNLVSKYQIDSYPRIIFMDDEGLVIGVIRGFLEANQFLPEMEKSYEKWINLGELKSKAEDTSDLASNYELANVYLQSGDLDKALAKYDLITKNDISNIQGFTDDAILNTGVCYGQQGKYEKAKAQFEFYINKYFDEERIAEAYYFLAITHLQLNEKDAALSNLQNVYEQFPNSPIAAQARNLKRRIEMQR